MYSYERVEHGIGYGRKRRMEVPGGRSGGCGVKGTNGVECEGDDQTREHKERKKKVIVKKSVLRIVSDKMEGQEIVSRGRGRRGHQKGEKEDREEVKKVKKKKHKKTKKTRGKEYRENGKLLSNEPT